LQARLDFIGVLAKLKLGVREAIAYKTAILLLE